MDKSRRKRQNRLDMTVATIHHRYGSGALVRGKSGKTTGDAAPHIPTGFPPLDHALGIGGLPRGRVCEIVGPATSGKTTLALKFLAQAQNSGGQVAYIDQALYFDPDYAYRCNLDLSRLFVGRSYDLGETLAMTEALVQSSSLAALVLDTLDFLWTDPAGASLLVATLDRLPVPLAHSGTILLVLHESQPGTSPALSALANCASVRLQVIRERWLQHGSDVRGYGARVEVLKNRLGPVGRKADITIEFNGTVYGNGL